MLMSLITKPDVSNYFDWYVWRGNGKRYGRDNYYYYYYDDDVSWAAMLYFYCSVDDDDDSGVGDDKLMMMIIDSSLITFSNFFRQLLGVNIDDIHSIA